MTTEPSVIKEKSAFEGEISKEIINFKTGETYHLLGGPALSFSREDIARIVTLCSQEEIYNVLFRRMLEDKPYTEENARWFIDWLRKGWEEKSHFVFIIRNSIDEIVGTLDIKSPLLDNAEVGYWADKYSSGFMTNALREISALAKEAGYKKLWARVVLGNDKSTGVLQRAAFNKKEDREIEGRRYVIFEKIMA